MSGRQPERIIRRWGKWELVMSQVRIQEGGILENPREYDDVSVENLRRLLLGGAEANRDPRRQHFYEIDGEAETYYIHISPVTGKVTLLARWLRQPQSCCADSNCAVA